MNFFARALCKRTSRRTTKPALLLIAAVSVIGLTGESANALPIVSPISVVASDSSPDPTYGTVANLINHGGLQTDFTSGVTDFDTYIAGNPQHTILVKDAEWFTSGGQPGATLTFNMGSVVGLDRLALWNEETWGAGTVAVGLSLDGITFDGVGSFNPTDWNAVIVYDADVFSFAAASAQYIQLTLSNCPQPNGDVLGGCGLGEVAFRLAEITDVPEPASLALLGTGLAVLTSFRRRRKAKT